MLEQEECARSKVEHVVVGSATQHNTKSPHGRNHANFYRSRFLYDDLEMTLVCQGAHCPIPAGENEIEQQM